MTGVSAPTDPARRPHARAQPSLKALALQHRRASLTIAALLLVFVALLLPGIIGSGSWKVTDATSCAAWSSANQNQQAAYARVYVNQHGPLPSGATSAERIENAINSGCTAAFAYDEADRVTVVQAINGRY